jgi:hypothetical protein
MQRPSSRNNIGKKNAPAKLSDKLQTLKPVREMTFLNETVTCRTKSPFPAGRIHRADTNRKEITKGDQTTRYTYSTKDQIK